MAPQTSYTIDLAPVAYPGQLVDNGLTDKLSVNASVALPYGVCAVLVSAANFQKVIAKLPGASTDITVVGAALGVVIADQARAQDPSVSPAQYPINSAAPVLRRGRIWVLVEENVNAGDQAYVRYATGSGTQLGAFRKSADTSTAAALPGAYYRTTALAAGYAVLELNLQG